MRRILFLFVFLFSVAGLRAGGFQVNAQGQRQLGMGHTGTGLLLDGAALFFNPGALVFLDSGWAFTVGSTFLFPRAVYLESAPGIYKSETVHHVGTPFEIYATWHLAKQPKLAVGLGVYTPFGSRVTWPNDWKGQFLIREIDLQTIFIQPTATYQVNEHVGIGAGFVYATGGFTLRKGVPVQDTLGNYGDAVLDGKASGMGYNLGVYLNINEHWSAGLSYRSTVKVSVDGGSADFTVPSALAEYFPVNTFSTTLKLPQVVNAGIGYTSGNWKLAADLNYVGWKSYDSLNIDFATNTDKLADIHSPRQYENAMIVRLGAQYKLGARVEVRGGAYLDFSPVPDGYVTPETPDSDKLGLTCGASFSITKNMGADVSLLFINGKKRSGTNLETGFSGTFQTRAIAPGIAFHYAF